MANKEIEIETNTLAQDISDLESELEQARKFILDMAEDMEELDNMWDGPANEAFMTQFGQDVQYAGDLCNMVEKLKECMEYAKQQYEICEAEVSSLISSI